MARPDPEKLAQALRTNLRRRKSGTDPAPAPKPEKAAEKPQQKPRPGKG